MKTHLSLLVPFISFLLAGCNSSPSGLPTTSMTIGEKTFTIEIAKTDAEQETGLMKRDSMPENHGMIFVFAEASVRSFWMKNTRIPLDIIFLDSSGIVVSIHQMAPYDLTLTPSDFPARYAIELNKGIADVSKVKVGDRIVIPPEAKSK